jgi:hypothetical protein
VFLDEAVAKCGPGKEIDGDGVLGARLGKTVRKSVVFSSGFRIDLPWSKPLWNFIELFFRSIEIVLQFI